MTENNDPWANLADTLGAAPGGEPPQQPQRRPAKPSKPAEAEKPVNEAPAAETSQTDWGGVADQLGIQSSASAAPEPGGRAVTPGEGAAGDAREVDGPPHDGGVRGRHLRVELRDGAQKLRGQMVGHEDREAAGHGGRGSSGEERRREDHVRAPE